MANPAKIPRQLTVTFDPSLAEALHRFKVVEGLASYQDTIRTLVAMALSSLPQEAVIDQQMKQAYNEVRNWMIKEAAAFFKEQQAKLDEAIRERYRQLNAPPPVGSSEDQPGNARSS